MAVVDRTQVAEQAIVTLLNGADFIDPDIGRHDLDCWYDQAAGVRECSCPREPAGVAYVHPLAVLMDATADGPVAA